VRAQETDELCWDGQTVHVVCHKYIFVWQGAYDCIGLQASRIKSAGDEIFRQMQSTLKLSMKEQEISSGHVGSKLC
jgi:hypothetical protein